MSSGGLSSARSAFTNPLVLLLMAALMLNYVDRGNLATAAPLIKAQLQLSSTQLGLLLSAFYWTYVVLMAPVGWATERFGARRVLAVGLAIWSLATFMTGFAAGFVSLFALRLMLGVGETAGFPCSSKMLATYVPRDQVGLANGILGFGYLAGPAIGTLLGGLLMTRVGWRPVFMLFGGLSLLWLWPWLKLTARESLVPRAAGTSDSAPAFGQILRQRALWGASLGHFAGNYNLYFILAWLPVYLVNVRGFSMPVMAGVASGAYLINALSALGAGWLVDRWVRTGRSATVIYKLLMALNSIVSIGCMAGMVLLPVQQAIGCLYLFEVVLGLSSPGTFGIAQIMAGPLAVGRWIGIQNTCANLAGILAPAITGMLVDFTGTFAVAFAVAGLVNVLGMAGWVFILPQVRPISWAAPLAAPDEAPAT